jgi:hypothetical protein
VLNIVTFSSPARPDLGCATQPSDPIKAGQQAWERLQAHQTWDDWKAVGFALAEGRTRAMAAARTNQPRGSRYNKIYSGWLGARGFDNLGKSTRARLLQCIEQIDEIETWFRTLKADKRLKLNHPTTVLSAWKRAMAPKPKPSEKPTSDWDSFFKQFTLRDFLDRMPPEWRDELLRRRDNLNKSRPDPKVAATPFIRASEVLRHALSLIKIATTTPEITPIVAASNEKEAIVALRRLAVILAGASIDEVTIIQQYAKERRRAA